MKRTLTIYQRGLRLNFFGVYVRTPVTLDISRYSLIDVKTLLTKWGISNYVISPDEGGLQKVRTDFPKKTSHEVMNDISSRIPKFHREKNYDTKNKIYNNIPSFKHLNRSSDTSVSNSPYSKLNSNPVSKIKDIREEKPKQPIKTNIHAAPELLTKKVIDQVFDDEKFDNKKFVIEELEGPPLVKSMENSLLKSFED